MKRMPAVLVTILLLGLAGCSATAAPSTTAAATTAPSTTAPLTPPASGPSGVAPSTIAAPGVDSARLVNALHGLGHYVGAESQLQVTIDVGPYVSDVIVDSSMQFVALGSVAAYEDFAALPADAIRSSATAAAVTLPVPTLDRPAIDMDKSYIYDSDHGIVNHIGDLALSAGDRQALDAAASAKLTTAAQASGLLDRARTNLRTVVTGLVSGLGYPTVTVIFSL